MIHNNKSSRGRGFTLVELLAVIVILAIILVIAVPKVMSIIEDAKMGTLESTAKMIASQAEKQKVQNTVLGNDKEITCESITNINKEDYPTCNIEFEDNTAKVTIIGGGKFEGLNVCGGTKTSATATKEECSGGNSGVAYIEDLLEQELTLNNGLIVDDTDDQNIRYAGATPNNKVYFNCKDTYNSNTYGSEGYDYANACETWRIIGVFNVKTNISDTKGTKRIKIIRDAFKDSEGNELGMSWDSSIGGDAAINSGYGINQWGTSGSYQGADLMKMLNGYYLGTSNTCTYCNEGGQETCSNDCTNNITPLSTNAQNMIGQAVWSTRGIERGNYTAKEMYEAEQTSTLTGKSLCVANGGGDHCNDSVDRTTEWEGKIGLIYPSDWGYASTDLDCEDITNGYGTCYENNWLYNSSWAYWTISPLAYSDSADNVWYLARCAYSYGNPGVRNEKDIRPTTYLNSNIKIIDGNGNDKPYILAN